MNNFHRIENSSETPWDSSDSYEIVEGITDEPATRERTYNIHNSISSALDPAGAAKVREDELFEEVF